MHGDALIRRVDSDPLRRGASAEANRHILQAGLGFANTRLASPSGWLDGPSLMKDIRSSSASDAPRRGAPRQIMSIVCLMVSWTAAGLFAAALYQLVAHQGAPTPLSLPSESADAAPLLSQTSPQPDALRPAPVAAPEPSPHPALEPEEIGRELAALAAHPIRRPPDAQPTPVVAQVRADRPVASDVRPPRSVAVAVAAVAAPPAAAVQVPAQARRDSVVAGSDGPPTRIDFTKLGPDSVGTQLPTGETVVAFDATTGAIMTDRRIVMPVR